MEHNEVCDIDRYHHPNVRTEHVPSVPGPGPDVDGVKGGQIWGLRTWTSSDFDSTI